MPEEAERQYRAMWPAIFAAKEAAVANGDQAEAKRLRQRLSALSKKYEDRHKLYEPIHTAECHVHYCPCCGQPIRHEK